MTILRPALRGIEILSDEGSWLPVPEALRASGSAMVNAFVHEVRLVTPFFRSGAGGTMESQQALAERVQSWAVECAAELQAAGGSISQDLELAVRRWGDRALLHAAERGIWCWNDYQVDQWLDELCRAGASGVDVPGILAVLRSALSDRIHSAPEGRFSNQLCTSLVTVRLHQLWAIWSATQRFDRSVFGDIDWTGDAGSEPGRVPGIPM